MDFQQSISKMLKNFPFRICALNFCDPFAAYSSGWFCIQLTECGAKKIKWKSIWKKFHKSIA